MRDLDAAAQPRPREQRTAGRKEAAVADDAPVHVSVRTDQDVVPQPRRTRRAPADQRVLHDDAARPDLDEAVLTGQNRAEEHARVRADTNVAAQDCCRRDIGARVDRRKLSSMLDEHGGALV